MTQEIDIEKMIAVGGISKKSPYVMQMLSDLSGREIHILDSDQTCAQGAAMYAAVGAGIYETLEVAAEHMAAKCIKIYKPDSEKKDWYKKHYQEYLKLAEPVPLTVRVKSFCSGSLLLAKVTTRSAN